MSNSKLFIVMVFTIALGAGVTVGRLWERRSHCDAELTKGPAFIAKELKLSDEQDVKMHKIWSKVLDVRSKHHFESDLLLREKEDKIENLLTPEQTTKFHELMRDYDRKQGDIERDRRTRRDALLKEREDAARALLTPEQKAKFEDVVQQYNSRRQQLEQDTKDLENNAVAETLKILDDTQRQKFEQMRKSREESLGKTPAANPETK